MAVTISLCMIVKNEEKVLARCLDSICDLMDEIIIVDTGSTDNTKSIAAKYNARIYDFKWCDDFSAARNFAFSKATMEYIYSADADEVLEGVNRDLFKDMKELLLPEIDIVQMKYGNQLENGTVYNFDEEYRPKLFKRLRPFIWEEPVHEQVRLFPVVYDSDIIISHRPLSNHKSRDISIFEKVIARGESLSHRLYSMYVRELYINGSIEELTRGISYFEKSILREDISEDDMIDGLLILAHAYRLKDNLPGFFKYVMKAQAFRESAEGCTELGQYYESIMDYDEAAIWYYNAAFEVQSQIYIETSGRIPLEGLVRIYEALGMHEQADIYKSKLSEL